MCLNVKVWRRPAVMRSSKPTQSPVAVPAQRITFSVTKCFRNRRVLNPVGLSTRVALKATRYSCLSLRSMPESSCTPTETSEDNVY